MMAPVRCFYNLIFPFALVLMLPGFVARMIRRGKYRHKFWQRFGFYSPRVLKKIRDGGRIWVHAVSVGEVMVALKLIHSMRAKDPLLAFVLSTTTSTGFKLAARAKCAWLEPIYNPLDFYLTARRAARTIRPRQLILIEAEVWPNIVHESRAVGATVALVNARLSPRSEKRYRLFRRITAPLFNQLDVICLQEPEDRARWVSLGVDARRLALTGSIKFDNAADAPRATRDFRPVLRSLGVPDDAPVLMGGSTFEGEEALLARVFQSLRARHPSLFLVIVPRHFERAAQVVHQIERPGLRVVRRTQSPSGPPPDVLIVDTTGELRDWYACATVAFVGKSLAASGGQNPAEPVSALVPVIFGPNMQNFAALARQFLRHGGAIQVDGPESLAKAVEELLRDPARRAGMVAQAARCLDTHRAATARTCEILSGLRAESR
jgi:3-deoxy-D-manno-octulosonic-acid transferase